MAQYLVTIRLPDDFDPSTVTEAMANDITRSTTRWTLPASRSSLAASPGRQREVAAGAAQRRNAHLRRAVPGGKEHVDGFSIIEAADLDEALAWARKGAVVCRASGEVREIFFQPGPEATSAEGATQPAMVA